MALALYRTYRPGSLAEVIGQEHVTEPLRRALESGRTHHAYLFSGPRGCGKTSTARILARSLNCAQGPTPDPCGQCDSCVELAPNGPGSMDVVELDAATHRGIDDARELREKAIYAPAARRFKIYIVDEAHQLTNEAANALLKLVEEPPAHLRFIFATTEPDKIIPTIRSRTFHYGFRLVSARTLAEHLAGVCRREGVPAQAPALAVVARAGAGSVRDSLSVLGQLLAGAGPDGLTYADATSALGLTDSTLIDDFVGALATGSAAQMFDIVDRVIGAGHDPRRFVTDVLDRLRDLIILRVDPDALAKGLVDVPDDAGQRMVTQAQSLGLAELSQAADLVSEGLGQIKGATAPRLQLELLCARLALPDPGDGPGAILARLERLERGSGNPKPPAKEAGTQARPRSPGASRAHRPESGPAAAASSGSAAAAPEPTAPAAPAAASGSKASPPKRPELRSEQDAPKTTSAGQDAQSPGSDGPDTAGPEPARPRAEAGPGDATADHPGVTEPAGEAVHGGEAEHAASHAAQPAPNSAAVSDPAPARAAAREPDPPVTTQDGGGQATLAKIQDAWPAVLDRLAASSRVAWTAFHAATPVSCSGGALAVAVAEPGNARAIAQRGHDERLRQAIIDVLALDLTIDVMHDPQPAAAMKPARGVASPGSGEATGPTGRRSKGGSDESGAARPADVVRAAGANGPAADVADEPSPDDPDLEAGNANGLALITRELGARPIGEIDHT